MRLVFFVLFIVFYDIIMNLVVSMDILFRFYDILYLLMQSLLFLYSSCLCLVLLY